VGEGKIMTTLLWFGRDLRLADNPALDAAIARGGPIVPVYILDDADAGEWAQGGASHWWLHGSLASLGEALRKRGADLLLRRGAAEPILQDLIKETGADAVYWNRRYEPWAVARNEKIKSGLSAKGVEARSFNAALLREPWTLKTQAGGPYRVFTPFWKALRAEGAPQPSGPAPNSVAFPEAPPHSDRLEDWDLAPTRPDWAGGLRDAWRPGEDGAREQLDRFLDGAVEDYQAKRNLPGVVGTSRLSPHLHFGEIGPRQIWAAVSASEMTGGPDHKAGGAETYLSEIAWREFSYHLLFHFPTLPTQALHPAFESMPWSLDQAMLTAWRRGQTGYPIVDAGMRELWQTGWMHNRVRMVVASFLIKHLMIDWRIGEAWFWDTLVDADLANNAASWQWVAGCGADAAPYFRIFNPVLQGEKFDTDGAYVRRWVPEIARLPNKLIHAPWTARPIELRDAGIALGGTYPKPIVDHDAARRRALAAYADIRSGAD
jgi:deoxyribodipyrimidine photo-lyase